VKCTVVKRTKTPQKDEVRVVMELKGEQKKSNLQGKMTNVKMIKKGRNDPSEVQLSACIGSTVDEEEFQ